MRTALLQTVTIAASLQPTLMKDARRRLLRLSANHIAKTAERKPGIYPPYHAQVCNLTACPFYPANRYRSITAKVRRPWCPAPIATRNPACSWPHCATPGAVSAGWSGSPASRYEPNCTSKRFATSAAAPSTSCWTTSKRACRGPICTSLNSTRYMRPYAIDERHLLPGTL